VGAIFFDKLFTTPEGCPIQEIIEVVSKFQSIFSIKMNQTLEEEIVEAKLLVSLVSMKYGKSPVQMELQ
jgi:hypothetical protein